MHQFLQTISKNLNLTLPHPRSCMSSELHAEFTPKDHYCRCCKNSIKHMSAVLLSEIQRLQKILYILFRNSDDSLSGPRIYPTSRINNAVVIATPRLHQSENNNPSINKYTIFSLDTLHFTTTTSTFTIRSEEQLTSSDTTTCCLETILRNISFIFIFFCDHTCPLHQGSFLL